MVKPVAGEIVAIPFPRRDSGKRRPAFVIADLPGADLILCQITGRAHSDGFAVPLDSTDCERRPNRSAVLYSSATTFQRRTPHHSSLSWKSHRSETR